MTVVSIRIPAKVTLFGEHAVVYNKPAIASTIPVFIDITGRKLDDRRLLINLDGASVQIKGILFDRISGGHTVLPDDNYLSRFTSYIVTGLDICEDELKINRSGYEVSIGSSLPIGAGLGTSAAISVGTMAMCLALSTHYSTDDSHVKKMVALLAWKTEQRVQGMASPMDTFTITYGGIRYIKPWIPDTEILNSTNKFNIIVGYTPKRYTTAELVKKVKNLRTKEESVMNMLLDVVEKIVGEARDAVVHGDAEKLGILMNINHGVLESMGVVSLEHSYIVKILLAAGALGAKTSGAGGGGAFIALARNREHAIVLKNIVEAFGGKVVALELYEKGFTVSYRE
ncbi:MAG: mevalonate kinase [Ignisphaera sp.]|nr:mevalonate kinase [Ignisphaera sp.]MDW8084664.1 mevalonate kinase [Ignisphaera sp.]